MSKILKAVILGVLLSITNPLTTSSKPETKNALNISVEHINTCILCVQKITKS